MYISHLLYFFIFFLMLPRECIDNCVSVQLYLIRSYNFIVENKEAMTSIHCFVNKDTGDEIALASN